MRRSTCLGLIAAITLALWPRLGQAAGNLHAETPKPGLGDCPSAPCQVITQSFASVFLELGDLHRSGRIDKRNGELAYTYYSGLVSDVRPVLSVIRPSQLVEILSDPIPPDAAATLRAYSKAAELGSAEGSMRLARLYFDGVFVEQDTAKALSFAKKARLLGHSEAEFLVSIASIRNADTETGVLSHIANLQNLAEMGDPQAQYAFGLMLLDGGDEFLSEDPVKAFELFEKSANQGHEAAQLHAARMKIFGIGTPSQPVSGLLKAGALAASGSMDALLLIAETYARGVPGSLEPNPKGALEAFRAAAEQGSATGQVRAGEMLILGLGVERNVEQGLDLLRQAANAGNTEALYKLGAHYDPESKDSPQQDLATAYHYYRQAAEGGDVWAKLKAAWMLLEGRGVPADITAATRELDELTNSGNAFAAEILAAHYETQSDAVAAKTYLEKAARAGSLDAQVQIGELSIQTESTESNVLAALEHWQEAARLGSTDAMYALGEFHAAPTHPAVSSSTQAAYQHFQSAADAGHVWASLKAATMLLEGQGTDPDEEAGLRQLKGLAMGGLPDASVVLADYYSGRIGRIDGTDLARAFGYLDHAAKLGHARAQIRVGEMLVHGSGVMRDVSEGLRILETSAGAGNAEAMLKLADMLARGHADKLDIEAALAFYNAAGDAGNIDALVRLAEVYRWGLFGTTDRRRAHEYLERAAALGSKYAGFMIGQGLAERNFGKPESVEEGIELLQHAAQSGVSEATAVLASLVDGKQPAKCRPKIMLDQLSDVAAAGSIEASLRLVAAYRDGQDDRGCEIARKDLNKAREALADVADDLTPETLEIQNILISLKTAQRSSFPEFHSRIKALAPDTRPRVMQQVIRANPNAFVYLLQLELQERGFYNGNPNGLLTSSTIRSVNALCRSLGAARFCRNGPFSTEVTTILFYLF
ncbi:tetratricopeptide repeat protein [Shimia sp.]|uniref:SEL1-like repeat protein n=1 Tax=Shimia sp. TaxID=1954381 RepID=UPI0032998558